jgi:aldehyde dehydrogenase family protein
VYGLGGCVITRDLQRGEHIAAEQIESGMVFVNEPVRSDPRLPFGGVKESGYGRELSSYRLSMRYACSNCGIVGPVPAPVHRMSAEISSRSAAVSLRVPASIQPST